MDLVAIWILVFLTWNLAILSIKHIVLGELLWQPVNHYVRNFNISRIFKGVSNTIESHVHGDNGFWDSRLVLPTPWYMVWVPKGLKQEGLIVPIIPTESMAMDSGSRCPTLSQAYWSLIFQLSQTAVVKVEMSSTLPAIPIKLNNSQP